MGVPLDLTTDPRTLKTSPPFPSLTFGGFATNRFVQRLIWKGGESLPSDMSLRVPAVTLVFGFSRRKPPSVEPDGKTSGKLGRPLTRLSPRHFFLFSGRRNVAQRRKERNVGESSAVQLPGLPQPFLHPRFGDKGPKGRNSSVTFGRLVTLDARNFGLWPAVAGRRGGDSSFTNILLALDSRFSIFYSSFLVVRLEAWNLRSPPRR